MASTSQCKYCGSVVSSADKFCPNCGAPNEGFVVNTEKQVFMPKTIEELKETLLQNLENTMLYQLLGQRRKVPVSDENVESLRALSQMAAGYAQGGGRASEGAPESVTEDAPESVTESAAENVTEGLTEGRAERASESESKGAQKGKRG